jgi:hypothetical protein
MGGDGVVGTIEEWLWAALLSTFVDEIRFEPELVRRG